MTTSIYEDDRKVGELTRAAFEAVDSRLLQIHRFSDTDERHVERLLEIFAPEPNERIADVGCGVGRLAELMSAQRPDLTLLLINKSRAQLDMCPNGFRTIHGTAENLPIAPGEVDAIMAAYMLGHVDLPRFVSECNLKGAGKIYVYDIFRRGADRPCRLETDLLYAGRTVDETVSAFNEGGYALARFRTAEFVPAQIERLMPRANTLQNTISAAMVFTR